MRLDALLSVAALVLGTKVTMGQELVPSEPINEAAIQVLAKFAPIDAHAHIYVTAPEVKALLNEFNLRVVDILVIDDREIFFKSLQPQYSDVKVVEADNPGRVTMCTTFSPYDFEQPDFANRVINQLDKDFSDGAVAVKFYKTIGMEIKAQNGRFLMPDDPVFDPIYDEIARRNRTVIAHLAEPDSCWEPPDPKSPDYEYYRTHPGEYALLHPEWPSKEAILTARDHVLKKHPNLRVVGAHLGSMERDVDQIAARFKQYPNFAVDTAARVPYFMHQPRQKVRRFLIKYQDRILYGTDVDLESGANVSQEIDEARKIYIRDWEYFATTETFECDGRQIRGLGLPHSVLRKLYHQNAERWFPGIFAASTNAAGKGVTMQKSR